MPFDDGLRPQLVPHLVDRLFHPGVVGALRVEQVRRVGLRAVRQVDGRQFRLIGVGVIDLADGAEADPPNLLDPERAHHARVEQAIDQVRDKLGPEAIVRGHAFTGPRGKPGSAED